jgi:hypothetical protein
LDDQLATYHQQWQYNQQHQIMIAMEGKLPNKSSDGKRKTTSAAITTLVVIAAADAKEIMDAAGEAAEIMTATIILKMPYAAIVTNRVTNKLIVACTRKWK